jgi:hypothetical protein
VKIRNRWDNALRQAVLKLPDIRFKVAPDEDQEARGETIELVDDNEPAADLQPQMTQRPQERAERPDRSSP